MSSAIAPSQRFSHYDPCPICGGYQSGPHGRHCYGYYSADRTYAYCSEHGGQLSERDGPKDTFRHWLGEGRCRCGEAHTTADPSANTAADRRSVPSPRTETPTQAHLSAKPSAIYSYCALETGAPLRKLRYNPLRAGQRKRFVWQRPGRVGDQVDWIDCRGDRPTPDAYRAETLADADPFAPLFITEGEKDCDKIVALGGLAMSPPDGKGSWRDEYRAHATARHVIVCADKDDDGGGQRHAEQVAASVQAVAATVRVLLFDDAHDVGDWLDAGHSLAELRTLAAATPIFIGRSPETRNSNRAVQDAACAESPKTCARCAVLAEQLTIAETSLANLRRERAIESRYLAISTTKLSAPEKLAAIVVRRELTAPTQSRPRDDQGRERVYRAAVAERLGVKDDRAGAYLRKLGDVQLFTRKTVTHSFGDSEIYLGAGPLFDAPEQLTDAERPSPWGGKRERRCKACNSTNIERQIVCRDCGYVEREGVAADDAHKDAGDESDMPETRNSNRAVQDAAPGGTCPQHHSPPLSLQVPHLDHHGGSAGVRPRITILPLPPSAEAGCEHPPHAVRTLDSGATICGHCGARDLQPPLPQQQEAG